MYKIKENQKKIKKSRLTKENEIEKKVESNINNLYKEVSQEMKKKRKVKKVNFEEIPKLNLPPRTDGRGTATGKSYEVPMPGSRNMMSDGNSSVENYKRYYEQNDANLLEKSQKHYQEYLETKNRQKQDKIINSNFEPQFLRDTNHEVKKPLQRLVIPDNLQEESRNLGIGSNNYGLNWIAKPTKEGFLYFMIPGTNTYQWTFPKFYDPNTKSSQYLFINHWAKKSDGSQKFWFNMHNPHFKQFVKPHSETYLIQAGIEGNLAFLEVYTKFKGDLGVSDQQGRSALVHSIANGHVTFTKMICEFSQIFKHQIEDPSTFVNLLELRDRHGNTPLFIAVRANQPDCLKILISYQCNFFHRKKNGNTILHECAAHNSIDCLIILASYCGQDLFSVSNKEGMRAIDISLRMKNVETLQALQKMERNMMYQNAVLEREIKVKKSGKKRVVREESSESSVVIPKRGVKRSITPSSVSSNSSLHKMRHLPQRVEKSYSKTFDEKAHFKYLKDKKSKNIERERNPTFRNYRSKNKDETISEESSIYYQDLRKQKKHQEDFLGEESYFKPQDIKLQNESSDSPREMSRSKSFRNSRQMYDSRFHQSQNMTIDDIEKQKFRTRGPSKSRKRLEPSDVLREHGYSIVEQAFCNTTSKLYSFVSFIYNGYSQLAQIMDVEQQPPEQETQRRGRKKVVIKSPQESDSEDNYQTAYGRSKSRARSRTLEQPRFTETHTVTKEISIQADDFIKIKKQTVVSKHSIGVGSICIDDTIQSRAILKKKVRKTKKIVDFSHASIASQKLEEHSRMIQYERTRRTGKKIGKKAQQKLMESKHFQSSEEEAKIIEESQKKSELIEPSPQYLREEVQYLKMADAFEKKDENEYQIQVNKMQELQKESELKLLKQSTPTQQLTQQLSVQKESTQKDNFENQNKQAEILVNDIKDFYNQLLESNIEEEGGSAIEFKPDECLNSLNESIDLEMGQKQKQEQFDYFQDKDSLNLELEGSLLQNFAECLSDCTFILQEKHAFIGTSKMQSNIFEKGQFLNSNLHNSCFQQQTGANVSINILGQLNHNLSGVGPSANSPLKQSSPQKNPYKRVLSDFDSDFEPIDEDKLSKVIQANIKAVPLPKHIKQAMKQRRLSLKSLQAEREKYADNEKPPVSEKPKEIQEIKKPEEVKKSEEIKKPEEVKKPEIEKQDEEKLSELYENDSQTSVPPGTMTMEEENDDTPRIDNAVVEEDRISDVELANNVEEFSLKKQQKVTPSQRYEEKEEEDSVIQEIKPQILELVKFKNKNMNPLRYDNPKTQNTKVEFKPIKSSRPRSRGTGLLDNVANIFQKQGPPEEHLEDLTNVDFDLTQFGDQTQRGEWITPRQTPPQDANKYLLEKIAEKIEKEIQKKPDVSEIQISKFQQEVSLSFEMSTVIKDTSQATSANVLQEPDQQEMISEKEVKEPVKQEDPNKIQVLDTSHQTFGLQNPMIEPVVSSDIEVQKISFDALHVSPVYPSDCEVIKNKIPLVKQKSTISTKSLGKKLKNMLDQDQLNKLKNYATSSNSSKSRSKSRHKSLGPDDDQVNFEVISPSPHNKNAQKILTERLITLQKVNTSKLSTQKSIREISFKQTNRSFNQQASMMTDNSERLRDTLEQFKKSKLLKELKKKGESKVIPRKKQ